MGVSTLLEINMKLLAYITLALFALSFAGAADNMSHEEFCNIFPEFCWETSVQAPIVGVMQEPTVTGRPPEQICMVFPELCLIWPDEWGHSSLKGLTKEELRDFADDWAHTTITQIKPSPSDLIRWI